MKKPWSPDLPVDNQSYNSDFTSLPDREGEKELAPDGTEEKKEREKKHTNFTLCNVCNIQLNSAAQAQIHYNGKSHQKRLKQLSNGNLKSDNGKHYNIQIFAMFWCENCSNVHYVDIYEYKLCFIQTTSTLKLK